MKVGKLSKRNVCYLKEECFKKKVRDLREGENSIRIANYLAILTPEELGKTPSSIM